MILSISEPRKQILIAMFLNNVMLLRERTTLGTRYKFIKPNGDEFSDSVARVDKYHMMFLEENNIVSVIWSEPMADKFVLTKIGQRLGKTLSRHYDSGAYKGKTIELEITGVHDAK